MPVSELLERFLRYVQIDTQSDEHSSTAPSTAKQLDLSQLLEQECRDMGLVDVATGAGGVVTATVPSNVGPQAPAIVWCAHIDTSPEFSGTNVKPVVHQPYNGEDIVLPGAPERVIRVEENPALKGLVGGTVVTSDGTTLLGSDDKSGVAVIMSAAARLMQSPDIPHGPVRLCFTCDEEIGRGVDHVDIPGLNAVCGYTLDGAGTAEVDSETFSADVAIVTVEGINTHPSIGKGVMVNAIRILADFLAQLPVEELSPETTDGRDGFLHPYQVEAGVARATARIILRDFETAKLGEYAALLESIADGLRKKHPLAGIKVEIRKQYRNMRDGMEREPRALPLALEAVRRAGMEPVQSIIRGGTDGSVLTERGLPTPNLSTGEHNPHSPLEWTSLEEMQAAENVLIQLAVLWGEETA